MYLVFYSTNDVFIAEKELISNGIECTIVPTPVLDKAYCGICLEVSNISENVNLNTLEYTIVDK